jgi:hypothetical protein
MQPNRKALLIALFICRTDSQQQRDRSERQRQRGRKRRGGMNLIVGSILWQIELLLTGLSLGEPSVMRCVLASNRHLRHEERETETETETERQTERERDRERQRQRERGQRRGMERLRPHHCLPHQHHSLLSMALMSLSRRAGASSSLLH